MPEHTAHAGCLEVGVEPLGTQGHADRVPLTLTFANRCDVPIDVDVRRLRVEGETSEGEEKLAAEDTRSTVHPGRLDPGQRAQELLAFGPVEGSLGRVCIDPSDMGGARLKGPAGVVCLDVPR